MNLAAIHEARDRLAGYARRTPLLSSPFLDDIAGRRVLIKAECLQHTGSFKFRGAWAAISALSDSDRARGVLAYSSGNHAQGIARAAQLLDCPAVIVMPVDAPALKIANTRAFGAEVILYERATESREDIGRAIADKRGLTLIPPYDDPMVIAGQASVGLEIAADLPDTTADVLVCCGGGGLTSGMALAFEAHAPGLRVRPVEPAGFDDMTRSLASGRIERNDPGAFSLCDAIVTPQPGAFTFPILQRLSGPGLVVTDDQARHAMALAFKRLKLVAEPGGAVALAAALLMPDQVQGDTVVCVLSGGNVDPTLFAETLQDFSDA